MTRFWADGLLITVTCDALATPQAFRWEQQRHVVLAVLDRWRVEEGVPTVMEQNRRLAKNSALECGVFESTLAVQADNAPIYVAHQDAMHFP
jgi:hypothetical protein